MKSEYIKFNSSQYQEMMMENSSKRGLPIITAFAVGIIFVVATLILVTGSRPVESSTAAGENVEMDEYVERIDLVIEGLKSKYAVGEPIVFTIRAQGMSDGGIACGDSFPPLVVVTDDSNGEKMTLNPVRFSRVPLCVEPMEFDREFVFGDKEEIVLERAGSYTLTASYLAN